MNCSITGLITDSDTFKERFEHLNDFPVFRYRQSQYEEEKENDISS